MLMIFAPPFLLEGMSSEYRIVSAKIRLSQRRNNKQVKPLEIYIYIYIYITKIIYIYIYIYI